MKNVLHFGKMEKVPTPAGENADSGNGYYSYGFYTIPFSGEITADNRSKVAKALHDRFYSPPFNSLGDWKVIDGNKVLVRSIYHHGD